MTEPTPIIINPWLIVSQPEGEGGNIQTMIGGPPDANVGHFGLLICDVVRHVARRFAVDESKVWYWVEKERRRPTTEIKGGLIQ